MNSSLKNIFNIRDNIELLDCDINDFTSVKATLEKATQRNIPSCRFVLGNTFMEYAFSLYATNAIGTQPF